jgi:hypothetical protein
VSTNEPWNLFVKFYCTVYGGKCCIKTKQFIYTQSLLLPHQTHSIYCRNAALGSRVEITWISPPSWERDRGESSGRDVPPRRGGLDNWAVPPPQPNIILWIRGLLSWWGGGVMGLSWSCKNLTTIDIKIRMLQSTTAIQKCKNWQYENPRMRFEQRYVQLLWFLGAKGIARINYFLHNIVCTQSL